MATFNEIISQDKLVLIDFSAEWCGPCKAMAPILKEVKNKFKDSLSVIKIDVDKNPAVAARYQVRGVPTLYLFRKGQPIWHQSGVLPTPQLTSIIQQYL